MPPRLGNVAIVGVGAKDATELAFEPTAEWYSWFLRLITIHDALFDLYFGRLAIAQLPQEVAGELARRVLRALTYWRARVRIQQKIGHSYALEKLRLYLEALARLAVRMDEQTATETFVLGISLGSDENLVHQWLFEPMGHLLSYACGSVPPKARGTLALAALNFPLSTERAFPPSLSRGYWPNPIVSLIDAPVFRPQPDLAWDQRIQQLISVVARGTPARSEAALRLYCLTKQGALRPTEKSAYADALWSRLDETSGLPADTSLHPFSFAILPTPASVPDAAERARAWTFNISISELVNLPRSSVSSLDIDARRDRIRAVIGAQASSVFPTDDEAVRLFDGIVAWRPAPRSSGAQSGFHDAFFGDFERSLSGLFGQALSVAVVPALDPKERTEARGQALLSLIDDTGMDEAIGALALFAATSAELYQTAVKRLRQGLMGRNLYGVSLSARALERWGTDPTAQHFPYELVEQLIVGIETRRDGGLQALLSCARKLARTMSKHYRDRLADALDDLATSAAYDRIDPDGPLAVSVSLVRAECMKLAMALEEAGGTYPVLNRWKEIARTDALPEVRFGG